MPLMNRFLIFDMTADSAAHFIFDVESIGLHGEGFAVAGGVYNGKGTAHPDTEFLFACPPGNAAGTAGEMADRDWVQSNVPAISPTHTTPAEIRQAFWDHWKKMQKRFKDRPFEMFAECMWPVEARFIADCIKDDMKNRKFAGPYPFNEIATIMSAAGLDPMATYKREPHELPAHHPQADARLSARLLGDALALLDLR